MRRGLEAFPFRGDGRAGARAVLHRRVARLSGRLICTVPLLAKDMPRELAELCIVANFVEVFLAREGHANPVGINYLEKIQAAILPCLYGAMLRGC